MELGLPDIEYNQYLQLRYFRNSTLNPAEIYILGLSSLNFKVLKPAQSHYSGLYFRQGTRKFRRIIISRSLLQFIVLINHINKIVRVLKERLVILQNLTTFFVDVILKVFVLYFVFMFYVNILPTDDQPSRRRFSQKLKIAHQILTKLFDEQNILTKQYAFLFSLFAFGDRKFLNFALLRFISILTNISSTGRCVKQTSSCSPYLGLVLKILFSQGSVIPRFKYFCN